MKRLQAKRLPLLTLTVMLASMMGLLLTAITRRVHAASTLHVTTTANSGAGSLRQAISDAAAGDTIDFNLSYPVTITLTSGELLINKNLTINGPGAGNLTVSGNNASRVFHLTPPATVTISGLTIAKGNSTDGGGILIEEAPFTLNDCVISNNKAVTGGGIYNVFESNWTMTNCTVSNNSATGEGGGINNRLGTLTMTNCTVSNNSTASNGSSTGGGIVNGGTLTMTNCTVSSNTSGGVNGGTGGIANGSAHLAMTNCTVVNNSAVSFNGTKGGIKATGQVILNNTIVAGNIKNSGTEPSDIEGGTVAAASHCLIGNSATSGGITNGANGNIVGMNGSGTRALDTIVNPVLAENGGPTKTHMIVCGSAAYNTGDNSLAASLTKDQRGSTRVIDGTIDIGALEVLPVNSTADSGPGSLRQAITDAASGDCLDIDSCLTGTITLTSGLFVVIRKDLTINGPGADKLTISGNNASAIFHVLSSNFAINRLTLANANGPGSAVNCDQSNLTLNNCTVSHSTGDSYGGILTTLGNLTLNNCTVSHNTGRLGGGILSFLLPGGFNPGQLTINSCTISDNVATEAGGGIWSQENVVINNSTISNNSARIGGGIYNDGAMTLSNCTVSNNSASAGGGGVYNQKGLIVTNSTITGNRSIGTGASQGGGVRMNSTETLNNSIIAGNFQGSGTFPDDLNGTADNASHNLIGDAGTSGGIQNGANGNIVGVSVATVLNTTLADNGGPTKTHALICGSPAIDAGDNALVAALATDQRGMPRVLNGGGNATATVDIGAFEKIANGCPTLNPQAVSIAKNSTSSSVLIATVNDAEDPEQNLAVRINGNSGFAQLNGILIFMSQPDAGGNVTANLTASCAATTTTFTLSVTDSAHQTVEKTLTVTVTPGNAPTISCPGNISQSAVAGQCSANVNFAATANDDCDGSLPVTYTIDGSPITSPHSFPKGTTTVTVRATDSENQIGTCTFTVAVSDTQAPAINCANVAAQSASTDSNCSAMTPDVIDLVRAQSSDNCTARADLIVTQSPTAGSAVSGAGSHPITVTVKDADNNSQTCVVAFTLNDTTKPTINCPANIVKATDPNQCAALVSFAPTASDNCSGVGTPVCTPPSGTSFSKGTTSVTCTVKDAANNQSSPCSFTVTVVDVQPPSFVQPQNISVPAASGMCSAVVMFANAAVSDNCPGVGAPTCTPPSGTSFPKGTSEVTCTVKDAANNQAACAFMVTVVDTQPPTIACPPNVIANTLQAGDATVAVSFAAPSAIDNCPGVSLACVPPSGATFPRGVTVVTCTATDAGNNQTSCAFTVRVFDYLIVDDTNGKMVRFDSQTGDYDFLDCRKHTSLSGRGVVTINSCKTTLTDSGPDARHPDRNVAATGNPCLQKGSATVVYQGVTHALNDANLSNNIANCP